jgi:RND family efflux transporter MFP subunit
VRESGSFNIGKAQHVNWKSCQFIQRDGCGFAGSRPFGRTTHHPRLAAMSPAEVLMPSVASSRADFHQRARALGACLALPIPRRLASPLRRISIVSTVLLAACSQDNRYVAPPPPRVTVSVALQRPVTRYLEATGNTAAVNAADLVARVFGFIQEINYQDGAPVKKGALLFTIEPEPYRIKLDQAKAAEEGARSALKQAQADLDRQTQLVTRQAGTQATLDQSQATRDTSQANVTQAEINTRLAALNLEYAHVTAPFDGIVTARQVSVGQFVGGGAPPTLLATIIQHDPIYVNFNISEQDVLRVRAEMARRGLTPDDLKKVPAEVSLQSETGYPHRGTLDYASPSVNPSTGTLAVRAVLPNASRLLLPGYFVRVRVPLGEAQNTLLVPDSAIGSDQGGRYVLVVDNDNVVEQRKVELGPRVDDLRVIDRGLTPQDRVVVAGILRAIPGQKVDPQVQTADAASSPAATSGPSRPTPGPPRRAGEGRVGPDGGRAPP